MCVCVCVCVCLCACVCAHACMFACLNCDAFLRHSSSSIHFLTFNIYFLEALGYKTVTDKMYFLFRIFSIVLA